MCMNIRFATIQDKEAVLHLVMKLAEYERKKPEEVELTLNKIESHGFGEQAYFQILLAEYKNQLVGYALYFFSYAASKGAPILYLEDLFVEPQSRGVGIGKALLSYLANIALAKHCCRMEWHAFTWNEIGIQFYKNIGAKPKEDLVQFRLEGDHLLKLSQALSKLIQ